MAGLPPTFEQHVAARQARKSLADGRQAINDRIRDFAASRRSTPDGRESHAAGEELRALTVSMDQGSRGAAAAEEQPITNANDALRAMFRAGREGNED